jgi:hypothetical protein
MQVSGRVTIAVVPLWILATAPDSALRDPAEAASLARRACELTGHNKPEYLDTLAAACAASGRSHKPQSSIHTRLRLFILPQKVVARYACLCKDRPQSRAFNRWMVGYCQGRGCPVRISALHRNVVSFSHEAKTQCLQGFGHSPDWRVNRELWH